MLGKKESPIGSEEKVERVVYRIGIQSWKIVSGWGAREWLSAFLWIMLGLNLTWKSEISRIRAQQANLGILPMLGSR